MHLTLIIETFWSYTRLRIEYSVTMTSTVREIPLEELLSVLGDRSRLKILRALKEGHEKCKDIEDYIGIHVSDLTETVGLSQSAVSQHLARLRQVGLVRVERRAQWSYYMRDEAALEAFRLRLEEV